jgi:hypothetical protein
MLLLEMRAAALWYQQISRRLEGWWGTNLCGSYLIERIFTMRLFEYSSIYWQCTDYNIISSYEYSKKLPKCIYSIAVSNTALAGVGAGFGESRHVPERGSLAMAERPSPCLI